MLNEYSMINAIIVALFKHQYYLKLSTTLNKESPYAKPSQSDSD